jgi:hypothetical protein
MIQGASLRKQWSDRFIPSYKQILANHLEIDPSQIRTATHEEDFHEATDLVLPDSRTVACKTRRASIMKKYPDEFALRSRAPAGHKSEWAKIGEGRGDLLLYTFSGEDEQSIQKWRLYDLDVLRAAKKSMFLDCTLPDLITLPDQDVHLISFDSKKIHPKYGRLLLAEG